MHLFVTVLISVLFVIGVPFMLLERKLFPSDRLHAAMQMIANGVPEHLQQRLEIVVPLDQPDHAGEAVERTAAADAPAAPPVAFEATREGAVPRRDEMPRESASSAGRPAPGDPVATDVAARPVAGGLAVLDQASSAPDPPASDEVQSGVSWAELYELGHELRSAGRAEDAVAALEAAAQLNPTHPAIHYDLGYLLQRMGDSAGAIRHYRMAIELRPDHGFALYNLGFMLDRAEEDQEAAALYARAVELLPDNPYVAFNFGKLLERQGKTDRAKSMYRRAAEAGAASQIGRDAEVRLGQLMRASS